MTSRELRPQYDCAIGKEAAMAPRDEERDRGRADHPPDPAPEPPEERQVHEALREREGDR